MQTRKQFQKELIRMLGELVAIPTVKKEDQPQHKNPSIHKFGKVIEKIAKEFHLNFRNVDNRIFEVTLKGTGTEIIGVVTHADIVPFNPAKWVLKDGRRLNPLKLTVIGNKMYGRGARDDKASIVAALFAMGAIKREDLALNRTIRLLIETTEETGGSGMEYYKKRNTLPSYNVVLDGRYPVGVAEKGFGVVRAKFPVRAGKGKGAEIISATGGRVLNKVPSQAVTVIKSNSPRKLKQQLDKRAKKYISENGTNFKIQNVADKNTVTMTVIGEAAHSASPQRGVNPVSRQFDFLHTAGQSIQFKHNHFTDAASFVSENWGLDYHGNKLGIAYADPFMGPLTTVVTYVKVKDGVLHLVVNPRAPRGKEPAQLIGEIRRGLSAWQHRTNIDADIDIKIKRYMYRNPKGPWIEALLDVFQNATGIKAGPRSSNGYTSARQLPNGVQFGPGIPGQKSTAHKANEFKRKSNFLRDVQIITEMMLRLSNLERME
jgi:predicted dipeptidase